MWHIILDNVPYKDKGSVLIYIIIIIRVYMTCTEGIYI